MKYKKLFSRGKIGPLTLRNRIVLPPMGTNMVGFTCEPNDAIIGFYEARAKGGCGLIITEIARIDDVTGIGMNGQLSVTAGKYVRGLVRLTDAVHKYDTKIFLQLQHPGRTASAALLGNTQPVAPSPLAGNSQGPVPRELTTEECEELVKKFATGAFFAKLAGFDGVELHAAHGYLINQFLSPVSNQRTDKYGGTSEKRMAFLLEIVASIQSLCGPNFPISVRLSVDEFLEGGLKIQDSIQIAQALEKQGVAAINVSAGVQETGFAIIEPQPFPEGWKKHLAPEIKKHVSIPVIAVNNIKNPATAEQYLQEGVSDFVGIARGQLADPEWSNKARTGRDGEIRKCISCLNCFRCYGMFRSVECTVNPLVGREYLFNEDTLKQNGNGKTVAVIGGGPAGMQAATICAKRGYRAVLFEKAGTLGGTVNLATVPPHKTLLAEFIKTQALEMELAGVEVRLNTEATVENVSALDPYGVIVAVGGHPIIPKLPGIELPHVYTAESVLAGEVNLSGKSIAIIGGGVTGLETAEVLSASGAKVTVVEMMNDVATTLFLTNKVFLTMALQKAGVAIKTQHRLAEITPTDILIMDGDGNPIRLPVDAVVLAVGVRPDNSVAEIFEAAFPHVTRIGDADKTGQIADALRAANDKAFVF